MKKTIATVFVLEGMLALGATKVDPESVVFRQDPASRKVTVNYTLENEPAIVTVDIQTNVTDASGTRWVSIGGENLRYLSGDVNKLVEKVGEQCTVTWIPHKTWEGHLIENGIRAEVSAWSPAEPPPYMVVSLMVQSNVCYYAGVDYLPYPITDARYRKDEMVFRKIPAAGVRWRMGHSQTEAGNDAEIPHYVTLNSDYYIGVFEVTADQWFAVKGSYPAQFTPAEETDAGSRPVASVTYSEVRGNGVAGSDYDWPNKGNAVSGPCFMGRLRAYTGIECDLPTDAQWEYACRAGTGTAQYNGDPEKITEIAWMADNAGDHTHAVGLRAHNAWGLYDMLGNVRELCLDWYSSGQAYSDGSDVSDPKGPSTGSARVRRGEGYQNVISTVRAARRLSQEPNSYHSSTGLRVACPIPGK